MKVLFSLPLAFFLAILAFFQGLASATAESEDQLTRRTVGIEVNAGLTWDKYDPEGRHDGEPRKRRRCKPHGKPHDDEGAGRGGRGGSPRGGGRGGSDSGRGGSDSGRGGRGGTPRGGGRGGSDSGRGGSDRGRGSPSQRRT